MLFNRAGRYGALVRRIPSDLLSGRLVLGGERRGGAFIYPHFSAFYPLFV